MKRIGIYKAKTIIKSNSDESVEISFACEIPSLTEDALEALFLEEAQTLENALYEVLPSGVYDRLIGLMLIRKSSHFIVSHVYAEAQ